VERLRKKGITALKFLFSALLLYLVFTRIPFSEVWSVLKSSRLIYLLAALLLFACSKVISAYRLNLYFVQIGVPLSAGSNLRLYLLGMFYNLFLPGGIGGDAYKGYLLHRTFNAPGKKLAAGLLLDRISGLFLLFAYSGILLLWLSLPWMEPYQPWIGGILVLSLLIYRTAHHKWFSYLSPVFWPSLAYSALVQLAQLGSVFFILQALGIREHQLEYLLVFLLSSIVAVLPITIGGIGSREVVFYYGARWLNLLESTSIGVSMAFFFITALVSLCGIVYHFRKPGLFLQDKNQS
jgi:uncharacterized membrane protein YbhN (UPF0104 family)